MSDDSPSHARRATIRATHPAADLVARALAPDDTESTAVTADGDAVVCRVERPTTGGLRSTVDDYVVNLRVATRVVDRASEHAAATDTRPNSTVDTNTQTDHTDTT